MGGRKTLISPLVISSGYDPPVCSNKARRRSPSSVLFSLELLQTKVLTHQHQIFLLHLVNTTPTSKWAYRLGIIEKQPTGSTANFVTANSPDSFRQILPSGTLSLLGFLCISHTHRTRLQSTSANTFCQFRKLSIINIGHEQYRNFIAYLHMCPSNCFTIMSDTSCHIQTRTHQSLV